jgi:hypothetical protein
VGHSALERVSLNQLAELFQRDKSVISRHIKNVFEEGELRPEGTVAKSATLQIEGEKLVTRGIEFYNLDAESLFAPCVLRCAVVNRS